MRRRRRYATLFSWDVFYPSILYLRHYMADCQRCLLLFAYHQHQKKKRVVQKSPVLLWHWQMQYPMFTYKASFLVALAWLVPL